MNLDKWRIVARLPIASTVACVVGFTTPLLAQETDQCAGVNDILLTNGKILTVDENDSVVTSLRIRGNTIDSVGGEQGDVSTCTQTIDLQGRTVIPGLIDSHVHWIGRASRPGHNVAEMDNAFSVAQAIEILQKKAQTVPEVDGEVTVNNFITAIGGYSTLQFAEGRLPNLEELDAIARPVYLSVGFGGSGQTNSAGIAYFEAHGVQVSEDGQVGQGGRDALAAEQTFEDKKRGTLDLMAWSAGLGLTTVFNQGGFDSHDAVKALADEGLSLTRVRAGIGSTSMDQLQRVIEENFPAAAPDHDMYRVVGVGEFIIRTDTGGRAPFPEDYSAAASLVAENGISYHQHSIPVAEAKRFLAVWEAVNQEHPITDLRWQLTHVLDMDVEAMDRLQALGGGLAIESHLYSMGRAAPGGGGRGTPGTAAPGGGGGRGAAGGAPGPGGGGRSFGMPAGPPYRTALEHGLPVGAGTDGGNIVTINPWLALYFMTTGKNAAGGDVLPPSETLTVAEALRLYTIGSAWFSFDEDKLGSLQVGKIADLAVLSVDILELEASDRLDDLRHVTSVLTIVDGDIVYSDGDLIDCRNSDDDGIWYRKGRELSCLME